MDVMMMTMVAASCCHTSFSWSVAFKTVLHVACFLQEGTTQAWNPKFIGSVGSLASQMAEQALHPGWGVPVTLGSGSAVEVWPSHQLVPGTKE